jgi:hypothetical protein
LLLASTVAMVAATVSAGSALAQAQCGGSVGERGGSDSFGGGGGGPPQQAVDPDVRVGPAGAGGSLAGSSAAGGGNSATTTSDDGAHDLFGITDRSDAPGRAPRQPNLAAEFGQDNVILRILTPVFEDGPRRRFEVLFNEMTV